MFNYSRNLIATFLSFGYRENMYSSSIFPLSLSSLQGPMLRFQVYMVIENLNEAYLAKVSFNCRSIALLLDTTCCSSRYDSSQKRPLASKHFRIQLFWQELLVVVALLECLPYGFTSSRAYIWKQLLDWLGWLKECFGFPLWIIEEDRWAPTA